MSVSRANSGGRHVRATTPPLNEPGDNSVDVPIVCVLTRFGLRHPFYLLPTYIDYHRTLKHSHRIPGLLRSAFLIENLTICYSLSIWSRWDDIPHFGTHVPYHVDVARRVFGRVFMSKHGGPEIWSTKWRLTTISNNLNWSEFDLRSVIAHMYAEKEHEHA